MHNAERVTFQTEWSNNVATEVVELININYTKDRPKATGFNKPTKIYGDLAKFLGLTNENELTKPELTKKVFSKLIELNLYHEKDKRIFKTNQQVTEIFGKLRNVTSSKQSE